MDARLKAMEEDCQRLIKETLARVKGENAKLARDAKEAVEAARTAEAVAKEAENLADVSAKAASGYFIAVSAIAEQREELVNDLAHVNESLEHVVNKEADGYGDVLDYSRDVRARKDKVKPLPIVEDEPTSAPSSPSASPKKRRDKAGGGRS